MDTFFALQPSTRFNQHQAYIHGLANGFLKVQASIMVKMLQKINKYLMEGPSTEWVNLVMKLAQP